MRRYSPPKGYVLIRLPGAKPQRRSHRRSKKATPGLLQLGILLLATTTVISVTLVIILVASFVR